MSLQALSDYTFVSRYARFNTEKNRRETWSEAVERVKNMHLVKYPMVRDEIEWAFSHVHNKVALGSQRALQFGGEPILKKNARIYNCISSYIDRPRVFQETFWLLLCGCGTGFSVQTHHVNKLPEFHSGLNSINDFDKTVIYQVDDSIEGWADALGVLIASYLPHDEFEPFYGKRINFDFSKIRPKGSMLSYGVGRAPGPDGLASSLVKIQTLLDSCLDSGRRRLRSIDAYDIIMHSSDAVLSGGVRRSATLCIFSPEDTDMLNAKIGDWYYTNPQRARSNNSALLIKDSTSRDTYHRLFESTRQFGEPGLIWADNSEALYNPCITSDSFITTKNGIEQVLNLIGKQFDAVVDGKIYQSSSKGFWKTGNKEIIELVFESGRKLKCTSNHKIMTVDGWQEAGDIPIDKEVIIHDHKDFNEFNIDLESSDYARGYLLGSMIGDGNFTEASCSLKWWGEDKFEYRKDAYVLLEKAGWLNNHHGKSSKEFFK